MENNPREAGKRPAASCCKLVSSLILVVLWLGTASFARASELRVVATIPPIHSLVSMVMAGIGKPVLLVPGGASPHSHAMRPSQVRLLSDADLIVWVGPALETFLVRPIANLSKTARVVTLIEAPDLTHRSIRPSRFGSDDGHRHDHDHRHDGREDPHMWLDPRNAETMVRAIAVALQQADPGNAGRYADNAKLARDHLQKLETGIAGRLAPVKDRPFLVFHDAFQHFEARFGLRFAGAVALDADHPPGAAHVRALRQMIIDGKVDCAFTEPQFPPKLVRALIDGTGVKGGILDPLGYDIPQGPDLYVTLMERNAKALEACLSAAKASPATGQ